MEFETHAVNAAQVAQSERRRLCELLREIGPDAPTMCAGWTTRDLAAHLVVRERQPLAAAGLVIPLFAGALRAAMQRTASKPWEYLLATVESGPPPPMKWFEGQANLIEFVVHREDVRRGGGAHPAEDRDAGTLQIVWNRLRQAAPLLLRNSVVTLRWPGHEDISLGRTGVADVIAAGSPVELLLMATGRQSNVEYSGSSSAIEKFRAKKRGI